VSSHRPRLAAMTLAACIAAALSLAGPRSERPPVRTRETKCGAEAKRPGVLRVVVIDETRSPVPEASVMVVEPRAGALLGSGLTSPDGSVEFKALGDKTAFVVAALEGFHSSGAEANVSRECDAQVEVTLTVAGTICDIEVIGPEP
jgi:hypothetical protein